MFFASLLQGLPESPGYTTFHLNDRNPLGGTTKKRKLCKPNAGMRFLHRRLIAHLRPLVQKCPYVTGALPKCSPLRNVHPHRHQRHFYLVDLRNAYQQVNLGKLADILCQHDVRFAEDRPALCAFLQDYCFAVEGGLATGLPASPDLFNLYTAALIDVHLAPLCRRYGLTYTRYLDDLTFSSKERVIGRRRRRELRTVIEQAGFAINDQKTGVYDLTKGPIVITGIGLEYGGRMFLPRSYLRRLRALIHAGLKGQPVKPAVIHGMMGVFRSTTPQTQLNRIEMSLLTAYRRYQRHESVL